MEGINYKTRRWRNKGCGVVEGLEKEASKNCHVRQKLPWEDVNNNSFSSLPFCSMKQGWKMFSITPKQLKLGSVYILEGVTRNQSNQPLM